MAELTFKSPGVSTREIDLSGPTSLGPQGTPAGIIGTSLKGRAFVPITVATYQDFVAEFGATDGEKFGPLAMNEWMRNARAGTYVKVLGVGDGAQRDSSSGIVANAGFVVGERLVNPDTGLIGTGKNAALTPDVSNPYAVAPVDGGDTPGNDRPQPLGRMTFLGSLLKDANSSGLLEDAGIAAATTKGAAKLSTAGNGTDAHGMAAGQLITLISTDTTSKTYVLADPALSDADTTAGSQTPLVANGILGANATVTGVKSVQDDALTVAGIANSHTLAFNLPAAGGGTGGNITIKILDALPGSNTNNEIVIRTAVATRDNLVNAINGVAVAGAIEYAAGGGGQAGTGINGITAENGTGGGNLVKLTVDRPGAHTCTLTDGGGGAIGTAANVSGGSVTAGTAGHIAIMLTGNQATVLNAIRTAVLHANGHNGKLTASAALTPAGSTQSITLTQAAGGAAGDSTITETLATIAAPDTFSGGSGAASGKPVLRAAIMAADGVVISLKSTHVAANTVNPNNRPPVTNADASGAEIVEAGAAHGTVSTKNGKQAFTMYLNGHKGSGLYPNTLKMSLDPLDPSYISKVLNTDPTKIREAGHCLYAHWDVHPDLATPDDAEVGTAGADEEEAVFVLVGAAGRNAGAANQPNFEDFQDRFTTARTSWFISQDFGAGAKDLFKIHALDDGAIATDQTKITIENIAASSNENNKFGKFDVVVRSFYDNDSDPVVLEAFRGVNLDRSSQNYVARRIGDMNSYYDFDQRAGAQKLRIEGAFTNRSRYVRVEMHSDVTRGALPETAIPCGFRGPGHLSLDSSTALDVINSAAIDADSQIAIAEIRQVKMVPLPLRKNVAQGKGNKKRANADLAWGVQFERMDSVEEPNKNSVVDASMASFTKHFPDHRKDIANVFVRDNAGAADAGGAVLDSDKYNHNMFTLERVQVSTGSSDRPVVNRWEAAVYRRQGEAIADGTHDLTLADGTTIDADTTRYLDPAKDFTHLPTRKYLKFTNILQGGFDGLNIFDKEASKMSDVSARREFGEGANQGGVKGSTISAYRKAVDVMEEKADVEIQLLAIPGMRHPAVTDYAVDSVETRFDAMLLMDIEEKDQENKFVTGSTAQLTNVTYTVNNFESRNLDSSFAAAYFPDVVITDPATGGNVKCPPSVAVLGAFSLNDSVSHPWFAPAGFTRGALSTVLESQVKLKRANLDALYEADINPITSFPHTPGVVVFGQKTLQAAQSALDRVNVRRLLIDIRRKVKKIAQSLLFEPNRVDTLARFSNLVNPVLQQIQTQQGLDRYKVQIDTSTTTQADVENNTIRGKIFLQPTRSLEFISLDFVVTNQGAEI